MSGTLILLQLGGYAGLFAARGAIDLGPALAVMLGAKFWIRSGATWNGRSWAGTGWSAADWSAATWHATGTIAGTPDGRTSIRTGPTLTTGLVPRHWSTAAWH